ncbi:uncharacterized protein TNCV_715461 [Trichonephila clavipes]|nr:uncharacterized protein TNCV_715461 [Trichonephila clavipes]
MNVVWLQKDMGEASPEFQIWKSGHSEKCQKNFDGSSGSMEMHAAYILWNRSISDCAMRYTTVLCDEECVNHVAKRLGTALRNKVKEWRSKGVTLGGRKQGSLTDATITKLQNFYRKAIVDNVPEVEKMKASIFATLFHCMSTDAKPMHSKCPDGKLSWCFYNRAKADNKVPGSHKSMKTKLSEEVVAKIMPVYQRLASNEILLRCVSGKTQNANESLHSCIWRKCPKDVFVSKKRINLAVTAAVSEVNIGYVETLKLNNNEMVDAAFLKLPTDAITEDIKISRQSFSSRWIIVIIRSLFLFLYIEQMFPLFNDDDDRDVHDDDHGDDLRDGRDDDGDHDAHDGHDDGGDHDAHDGRDDDGDHDGHGGHDDDVLHQLAFLRYIGKQSSERQGIRLQ